MIRNGKRLKLKKYCNRPNQCQLQNCKKQTIIAHQRPSCWVQCYVPSCHFLTANEWKQRIRPEQFLEYEMLQLWCYYIFQLENTCGIAISGVTNVSCLVAVKIAQFFNHRNGFINCPALSFPFICLPSFSHVLHNKLQRNVKVNKQNSVDIEASCNAACAKGIFHNKCHLNKIIIWIWEIHSSHYQNLNQQGLGVWVTVIRNSAVSLCFLLLKDHQLATLCYGYSWNSQLLSR